MRPRKGDEQLEREKSRERLDLPRSSVEQSQSSTAIDDLGA